jgi:hypothetical protein
MDQMISVIGLENAMVDESVAFERIGKIADRPVHDEAMQRPFKEGGKYNGDDQTGGRPE